MAGSFKLLVHTDLCVACRSCQLWCSFSHEKVTHVRMARLDIALPPNRGICFDHRCNACGICARICPTGAIELVRSNG